jgi:hypothetical protein
MLLLLIATDSKDSLSAFTRIDSSSSVFLPLNAKLSSYKHGREVAPKINLCKEHEAAAQAYPCSSISLRQ